MVAGLLASGAYVPVARAEKPLATTGPGDSLSATRWGAISDTLFAHPELALAEQKSAEVLARELEKEGFRVERSVAGMRTGWVATVGSGSPVIGILVEYDALPGLSQRPGVPRKDPLVAGGPGHGCGHNLLGTAAVAAAVAANQDRIRRRLPGTRRSSAAFPIPSWWSSRTAATWRRWSGPRPLPRCCGTGCRPRGGEAHPSTGSG